MYLDNCPDSLFSLTPFLTNRLIDYYALEAYSPSELDLRVMRVMRTGMTGMPDPGIWWFEDFVPFFPFSQGILPNALEF